MQRTQFSVHSAAYIVMCILFDNNIEYTNSSDTLLLSLMRCNFDCSPTLQHRLRTSPHFWAHSRKSYNCCRLRAQAGFREPCSCRVAVDVAVAVAVAVAAFACGIGVLLVFLMLLMFKLLLFLLRLLLLLLVRLMCCCCCYCCCWWCLCTDAAIVDAVDDFGDAGVVTCDDCVRVGAR